MKLTDGIFILAILCISLADAIEDLMPLDVPKPQIKKSKAKEAKKHDILLPIENSDTLTHADGNILEGLSDVDENDDDMAASRETIASPRQEEPERDVSGNRNSENRNSGKASSKEGKMDLEAKKFDAETPEKPALDEKYNQEEDKSYDDGVLDEANNIADLDPKDQDDEVNLESMNNNEEWGKEVHDDD